MRLPREDRDKQGQTMATDPLDNSSGRGRTELTWVFVEASSGSPLLFPKGTRAPLLFGSEVGSRKTVCVPGVASPLGPEALALFPELFPSGPAVLNLAPPRLIMCSEPLLQQRAFCAEAGSANPPYTCHQ